MPAALIAFENLGSRLAVSVADGAWMPAVEKVLPVGSRRCDLISPPDAAFSIEDRGGAVLFLTLDGAELRRGESLESVLVDLESELHFQVALHARNALFVHAGVVGWRGAAIVLPGRSRSGKTTLVAALVAAGAEYYSDEYAVIDEIGRVHSYAKPLSIRLPTGGVNRVDLQAQGLRCGESPLSAGLIVHTSYAGPRPFQPAVAPQSRGLMALIDNTLVIRERPRFAMTCLSAAIGGAVVMEGPRGEADEAARHLLSALSALQRRAGGEVTEVLTLPSQATEPTLLSPEAKGQERFQAVG